MITLKNLLFFSIILKLIDKLFDNTLFLKYIKINPKYILFQMKFSMKFRN